MKVLVLGGSKSGKSMFAQRLVRALAHGGPMLYWATMIPTDREDEERIAKHLSDRAGWGFETVECGRALQTALPLKEGASVLFDSVTALLANEMFLGKEPDASAPARALDDLIAVSGAADNFVCVCDDLFRDGSRYEDWTDEYVRGLGRICCGLAEQFDVVCEIEAGLVKLHKGALAPETLFEINGAVK